MYQIKPCYQRHPHELRKKLNLAKKMTHLRHFLLDKEKSFTRPLPLL
jgi:hypothetical protein